MYADNNNRDTVDGHAACSAQWNTRLAFDWAPRVERIPLRDLRGPRLFLCIKPVASFRRHDETARMEAFETESVTNAPRRMPVVPHNRR